MPSQLIAKTYYSVTERGTARSIKSVQAQLKRADFDVDVDLHAKTARLVAETKAAIQEAKAGRHVIQFETNRGAVMLDEYMHERELEREHQSEISSLIGNGIRKQFADRMKMLADVKAAEIRAYAANDGEMRRIALRRARETKAESLKMARVLGSEARPFRGAVGKAARAFPDRSPEVVAEFNLDLHPAEVQAQKFRKLLLKTFEDIKPGVDLGPLRRGVEDGLIELRRLTRDRSIPIDIRSNLKRQLDVAEEMVSQSMRNMRLSAVRPIRITVIGEARLAKVKAEIEAFKLKWGQPIRIAVWVRDNLKTAAARMQAFRAATSLSNIQIGRMGKIISAVILLLGPLAISLGGATNALGGLIVGLQQAVGSLGALPGLITVAIGAFAALKVGFGGTSEALKAFTQAQKANSSATRQTLADLNAVREAQWSLDQTRISGDNSVRSAMKSLTDAEKAAGRSQLGLQRARIDYNKTLREQKRLIEDIAGSEEDAAQTANEAYQAWQNSLLTGDATASNRARIDYQKALKDEKRLVEDNAAAREEAPVAAQEAENAYKDALDAQLETIQSVADAETALSQARAERDHANLVAQESLIDAQNRVTESTNAANQAFVDAMAKLSPAAQELVNKVIALRDAWGEVKRSVQEALLTGAAGGLQKLSDTYLPIVQTGLVGIAGALNGLGSELTSFLTSAEGTALMESIFRNIEETLLRLRPAIEPFMSALLTILDVSSGEMPGLVDSLTEVLNTFNSFVQAAAADGSLAEWIRTGVESLGDLLELGWQVLGLIGNLGASMNQSGASPLQVMADALRDFNASIAEGTPGRAILDKFFQQLSTALDMVMSTGLFDNLLRILEAFGNNIETIQVPLSLFAVAFSDFIATVMESGVMTDLLNVLLGIMTQLFTELSRPEVKDALQQLGDAFFEVFSQMVDANLFTDFATAIAEILPRAIPLLLQITDVLITFISGALKWLVDHPDFAAQMIAFITALNLALPLLIPLIGAVVAVITNFEVAAIAAGVVALVTAFIWLYDWLKDADWGDIGKDLLDGLMEFLLGETGWENIKKWGSQFIGWIKDVFGIHSPSTVMREIGGFLMDGLVEGIQSLWTRLGDWGTRIVNWVASLPSRISTAAVGMFDGLKEALRSAINWCIEKWNGLEFGFKIPETFLGAPIPLVGGKELKMETPDITKFSTGGQVVVAREAGDERIDVRPLYGQETMGEQTARRQNDLIIGLLQSLVQKDPNVMALQLVGQAVNQAREQSLKQSKKELGTNGDLAQFAADRALQLLATTAIKTGDPVAHAVLNASLRARTN